MKFIIALLLAFSLALVNADELASSFLNPPAAARPWVYWFWNNGNVTKAGITADLEAMQRAGIGGVIIMDVVERFAPPPGTADFMNPEWQDLFGFAVSEAHRLGLKINMTNGPGWCGSSGPWITPEMSMQMLVATNLLVDGPAHFSTVLPQPSNGHRRGADILDSKVEVGDYYADVAVLAYPATTNGFIPPDAVLDLSTRLAANGQLTWEIPDGHWIILRMGHTSTGSSTRPPVKGGNGLECDKLSAAAMDVHFTNMMGKLIAEVGPLAGETLTTTHIDSWEVGSQNWTPAFREEFLRRRGYDPLRFLPNVIAAKPRPGERAPVAVGDPAIARRFAWDFRQTIAELLATNYVGRLAELAHQHGLQLSIEGYNLPLGDEAAYTEPADEPMTEFWATGAGENATKCRQMASVAHIMGRNVVGAEAFTSGDHEQWKMHPATIKALGDYEFSQGVNRFVIHRYAHQPYLNRFPGVTMGPWGLHYERTQTWWEMSTRWHQYLTRCQFMLRQGLFVADLCYLRPESPDQTYFNPDPAAPTGYKFDECSAGALIARMSVEDGRLVLPDGMSYRLLVLPANHGLMTPALAGKIRDLVSAGATVVGPRPSASPSLSDYPGCDARVARLADEIWGDCDGRTVTEHHLGKGRIIWGRTVASVLAEMQAPADFTSSTKLNWIHRQVDGHPVYFVANPKPATVESACTFRVHGLRPELWNPETGEISPLAVYQETADGETVPLRLAGSGSVFVIFRAPPPAFEAVTSLTRNGQPVGVETKRPAIKILRASYGVPGDAARTRNVQGKMQAMADREEADFQVAELAQGDDPAYGTVKTLVVSYTVDGQPFTLTGQDPDTKSLLAALAAPNRAAELRSDASGQLQLVATQPGNYELKAVSGKTLRARVTAVPAPLVLNGPWEVSFPPKWGAPDHITLDHLASLSDSTNDGVRFFSGTATYRKTFDWQPAAGAAGNSRETWLDLGDVQVMAQVTLNGQDLGIVWKAPFQVNIARALQPGANALEIRVANLWPNRMIGDAALPATNRFTWSTYEPFTKNSPLPKSGLLGPVSICFTTTTPLP